jgi:hypothetical protein
VFWSTLILLTGKTVLATVMLAGSTVPSMKLTV